MQSNLFKPEAERKRELTGLADAIISFVILLAFIASCILIGIYAESQYDNKPPVNHLQNKP